MVPPETSRPLTSVAERSPPLTVPPESVPPEMVAPLIVPEEVRLPMTAVLPVVLPMLTAPVPPVPMLVAPAPLVLMLAAPEMLRPPVPWMRPVLALRPAEVTAPALVTLKLLEVMRFVKVPVRLMPLVIVPAELEIWRPLVVVPPALFWLISKPLVLVPVPLRLTSRASAAPDWLMMAAVAAAPEVPLTVRPTTLSAVGVTVFCAVVAGTCWRQVEQTPTDDHVGNDPGPLEISVWPAAPAPMFWKAPVEVVPPASRPYGVVDE